MLDCAAASSAHHPSKTHLQAAVLDAATTNAERVHRSMQKVREEEAMDDDGAHQDQYAVPPKQRQVPSGGTAIAAETGSVSGRVSNGSTSNNASPSSPSFRRNSLSALVIPSIDLVASTSDPLQSHSKTASTALSASHHQQQQNHQLQQQQQQHHLNPAVTSSAKLLSDIDSFTNPRAAPSFPMPRSSNSLPVSSVSDSPAPFAFARSYSYDSGSPSSTSTQSSSLRPITSRSSPFSSTLSRPNSCETYSSIGTSSGSSGLEGRDGGNMRAGTRGSTRPWVRDSDASSICSAGTGHSSSWSAINEDDGSINWVDEGGEVYKVGGDGIEFLDPRPEPAGARLTIERDDPTHVILKVALPGFTLENITVAMRRGHRVHIVADSYGENGGHFEKLVSLGSEVHSAAPRAEFNGTELSVFVQRRQRRSLSQGPLAAVENPSGMAASRQNSIASYRRGSTTSSYSTSSSSAAISPTELVDPWESPIATATTANQQDRRPSTASSSSSAAASTSPIKKMTVGPEGAKAAARVAKEEAAVRTKEQAKGLPKMGGGIRKFSFVTSTTTSPAHSPLLVGDAAYIFPITSVLDEPHSPGSIVEDVGHIQEMTTTSKSGNVRRNNTVRRKGTIEMDEESPTMRSEAGDASETMVRPHIPMSLSLSNFAETISQALTSSSIPSISPRSATATVTPSTPLSTSASPSLLPITASPSNLSISAAATSESPVPVRPHLSKSNLTLRATMIAALQDTAVRFTSTLTAPSSTSITPTRTRSRSNSTATARSSSPSASATSFLTDSTSPLPSSSRPSQLGITPSSILSIDGSLASLIGMGMDDALSEGGSTPRVEKSEAEAISSHHSMTHIL